MGSVAASRGVGVDPGSFVIVVVTAAVAGTVAALVAGRGLLLPSVVVEFVLG